MTGNGQDSSTTEQAKEKVQDTAQQAKSQASGRLREQVDQRSTQAGEQVATTVSDVRSVAEQLREQGKEQPAKIAEQAAERAEKVGNYLKQSDGDAILRDVEDFGRRQPWAVMFGGLAAGFLASRFLKASSTRRYETGYQGARGVQPPSRTTGPGVVPPATSYPPSGTVPPASPGTVPAPTPIPPAGADVSLSGGVVPPGSPGATRPTGPAGGTR